MTTGEPTQKAKLRLRAVKYALAEKDNDDYCMRLKLQKCLTIEDLARDVAALSFRKEDPDDVIRIGNMLMDRMMWYLSSGFSISTKIGNYRPTVKGILQENELGTAPDRSRITLSVNYSMSRAMKQAFENAILDVEILQAMNSPQLSGITSIYDAEHPEAVLRGERVAIRPGMGCMIRGKRLKVGGDNAQVGVTLTRQDGDTPETYFFPPQELYPNHPTRVGFVLPATVETGSVWNVTLSTQIGSNGSQILKEPRTTTLERAFIVGE